MSVSSVYVREIAQGDGVNTVFGFPWKFVAAFDLMVYIDDVLQPASAYEVKNPITKDRGEIVFRTAPAVGAVVVIRRMDNQQQTRLFKNQENFNAHEVEKAFDKLTLLVQEGFEELRRGALRMQSQSNLDYTIEDLTIDDGMLALDLASKTYKQTSFTQAQVQKVIDEAVRSADYSVKNMRWDDDTLVVSFSDGSTKKDTVSDNVAQIRAQHDDDNNWWLEWSLDGQIWKSSDAYTKTEIDTALSTKADTAALTAEITRATNAESELSGRITTNAEEISTIKTDLDDLGDQVHGIEEKIPAKASTINQLATMADVQQAGGLSEVVHDDTMTGTGMADSPLSVQADDFVKKSATEMQALSSPLTVKEEICLTDPDDNAAKHSLAIVAGIPTETAEEMDIVGARKFDELPTTDDVTTYDDLNPKKLITKGQVASAVSVKATKSTDFMTPITAENKGATKTETDLLTASIAEKADKTALSLKQDIATALNYNNITNCITEIPQDIKLELNNGTLTLKAGSKVYVPNGAGVFDEVVVASDLTISLSGTLQYFIFVRQDGSGVYTGATGDCFSGATQPTVSSQYAYWYDTANNVIKFTSNTGSTWTNLTCSLPVAIANVSSGVISSIDQVFNGFGYIGSTRFALPNIKWLSPNGRNADGTLKSTQRTNTNVLVETSSFGTANNVVMVLSTGNIWTSSKYIERETEPSGNYIVWYKPSENILREKAEGSWVISRSTVVYGYFDTVSNKITGFETKQSFRALDYGDTEYIAHQAMPSSKSIKLTLGASGSTYTAPADGWLHCVLDVSANGYLNIQDNYYHIGNTSSGYVGGLVPVRKGQNIFIFYANRISTVVFSFKYAEGAQ